MFDAISRFIAWRQFLHTRLDQKYAAVGGDKSNQHWYRSQLQTTHTQCKNTYDQDKPLHGADQQNRGLATGVGTRNLGCSDDPTCEHPAIQHRRTSAKRRRLTCTQPAKREVGDNCGRQQQPTLDLQQSPRVSSQASHDVRETLHVNCT
mgnify:CR=1 FL=1